MLKRREISSILKFLGVLCVFAFGYITIVATSGSDVADTLGIDTSFSEDLSVLLSEITVDQTESGVSVCGGPTSIQDAVFDEYPDAVDYWDNIEEVVISGVTTYWDINVVFSGVTVVPLTCTLYTSREGTDDTVEIANIEVSESGATSQVLDATADEDAWNEIVYLVDTNPEQEFTYCVVCTGDDIDIDSYSVTGTLEVAATVNGEAL